MLKTSTNFQDRNAIKRWMEAGKDAHFISNHMRIEIDIVAEVMSRSAPELTRGQKGAVTRAANRAAKEQDEKDDIALSNEDAA